MERPKLGKKVNAVRILKLDKGMTAKESMDKAVKDFMKKRKQEEPNHG